MRSRAGRTAATLLVLGSLAGQARADAPPTGPAGPGGPEAADRLRAASAEYDAGRRAYVAGDFAAAAVHFENAWRDAPRAESLRSAIRARRAAKQAARAATLAAVARARYPDDAATQALASETLTQLAPSLHEVRLACSPACGVAIDGRAPADDDATEVRVFVEPGTHELAVSWPGERLRRVVVVARPGASEALALEAPRPAPAPALAAEPTAPSGATPPRPGGSPKPFGPAVFVVFAAVTAVGAGITTWSGIDTLQSPGTEVVRARCAGLGEACPEYQQGRDAQLRTNVALAVTGALAVTTGVVGVFFTQWSAPGGGGVAVRGAF